MDPPLPPPLPPQPPQQPAASEPRRYAARFSTSSFLHAPLSVLLDYSSGILRDHAAGGPHHHGAAGGGGGDGEVSIRIVGPAEAAPLEPRAGEAVAVDEGTPATSAAEAPSAGGGSGESLYHRYDVQRVARWVEHALPFSLLLLGVFIRQHLRGFFVAIWIAAVMFKSNDILRKQTALKVLDDSDDATTSALIKEEVEKWQQEGVRILYRHRVIRDGYKAGNLKSAMNCSYVKDYEFVVIFDANFQPQADFLKRAVPHFKGNEDVGLVQARWSFVNKDENLLTRLQNINMCFHFEVEQQVNGVFLNFFGFNGTAGVWRIKALEDSGGWMERTTVEDMDIAVRAHLKGWKFLFLNDVECQCELPESYEAYRKQQHRWHSSPMQLFRSYSEGHTTSFVSRRYHRSSSNIP